MKTRRPRAQVCQFKPCSRTFMTTWDHVRYCTGRCATAQRRRSFYDDGIKLKNKKNTSSSSGAEEIFDEERLSRQSA